MHSFMLLTWDRPLGGMGGVGGLSTVAVLAMAELMGHEPESFLTLCRAMDSVYLDHVNAPKK